MRRLAATFVFSFWCAAALACGSDSPGDDDDDDVGAPDAGVPGDPDAAAPGGAPQSVAFPQAIAGAMLANPNVYAAVPVHLDVPGGADEVEVALGDGAAVAARYDGGDRWTADVDIATVPDGGHELRAVARGSGAEVEATATLRLARAGVQMTDFAADGAASTPRLHRAGDALWLTWADRSEGPRTVWLQALDGAARSLGERVQLLDRAGEVHYARTAAGASSIAVLFQEEGGPYASYFTVVTPGGEERLAPIALDPEDRYGSFGGAVRFDGEAFVAVWRTNQGNGRDGEVRWLRYVESTGELVGPIVVAESGPGTAEEPDAGFDPFTFVSVTTAGTSSVVGFVRHRYDAVLELELPKAQTAVVTADGTVSVREHAGVATDWSWHHELRLGDDLALWASEDLNRAEPIPTVFRGARVMPDGALDPTRGAGTAIVDAPDHRSEPVVIERADAAGGPVLAWLDQRSKTIAPPGKIELWAAPLDPGALTLGAEAVFGHAVFIEGTSQLHGVAAGTNAVLVWLDERHGSGLFDPRPEVWIETAWF